MLHGLLLADQLGAKDQHLLLADVQLLAGGVELVQHHLVGRGARGPGARRPVSQQALPHLRQVELQLLVLRLQLLALRSERSRRRSRRCLKRLLANNCLPENLISVSALARG